MSSTSPSASPLRAPSPFRQGAVALLLLGGGCTSVDYEPCVDAITEPSQVAWELSGGSPGLALRDAVADAIDPSCLASCTTGEECTEANCTTITGAELTYREEVVWSEDIHGNSVATTVLDATVVFPPVHDLTELTVHRESVKTYHGGLPTEEASTTGSWMGRLHPSLPLQGVLVETEHRYDSDYISGTGRTFIVNDCETRYVEDTPTDWDLVYVERAGQLVLDRYGDIWLDGECVGHAEDDTYEVDGSCRNPDVDPEVF